MEKIYDIELKKLQSEGLKWIPWVGENYRKKQSKILILGESHFRWKGQKNVLKMLHDFNYERNHIIEHYIKIKKGNKNSISVLDNLLRALYNKNKISPSEKLQFAKDISYGVIVQKPMLNNRKRPRKIDYTDGLRINSKIIQIIKPKNVIFIGVESIEHLLKNQDNIMPLEIYDYKRENKKINNTYPRKFKLKNSNEFVNCIAIRHTASYFSWELWNKYIWKNLNLNDIIN